MVGYSYVYSLSDGPMLQGEDTVSDMTLAHAGFSMAPETMHMHMLMPHLMYAPSDRVTLMLMPMFMTMEMQMRPVEGAMMHGGGHGGHDGDIAGGHSHETIGIGDTVAAALVRVFETERHHMHVGIGFSAPTGAVDEKGADGRFTHYMMQLGSGTWDFLPSVTYTGGSGAWSWGVQASANERLEDENESGFRFGDKSEITAWAARELAPWVSVSLRLSHKEEGKVEGHYNGPHNHASPPDLQANYGGRFDDIGIGLNLIAPGGALAGHRLGIEWLQPLRDDPNGFQQERTGTLSMAWSKAF